MRNRFLVMVLTLLFSGSLARAADAAKPAEASKPVDVVICLDVSNSMDGLIDSAKRKLWAIVNDLAKFEPAPALRVGLYSYGSNVYDAKTGWVRKEVDLTNDLDEVYKKLNDLKTRGGDEYVARVTQSAIKDMKWATEKDALKLIFVCGNEPANQDKEISLESVAEVARKQGIYVNTIYCGSPSHPEAGGWQQFAASAGGKYSNIDQNKAKSELVIKTPQDAELLKLNDQLNATYVTYGKGGEARKVEQALQDKNAAGAAPGVALERAATKAGQFYQNDRWDIVDRMKRDKDFDVKKLKDEELCEEMRKLKPEEREAFIKKKAAEREDLQKKITELAAQRAKHIEAERQKQPKTDSEKRVDAALQTIIRDQATSKGFKIK